MRYLTKHILALYEIDIADLDHVVLDLEEMCGRCKDKNCARCAVPTAKNFVRSELTHKISLGLDTSDSRF